MRGPRTPPVLLQKPSLRSRSHQGRRGGGVVGDRAFYKESRHWKKSWKELYGRADKLYVLAREDGTVGLGIYKQWKFLSERAVPSEVFFEGAKSTAAEEEDYENFRLKRIEVAKGEEDLARFALVDLRS